MSLKVTIAHVRDDASGTVVDLYQTEDISDVVVELELEQGDKDAFDRVIVAVEAEMNRRKVRVTP